LCVERCRRVRRYGEQQEERVLKKAKKIKKNRAEGVLGLVRLECDVMGLNWEGSILALGEAPGSSTDGFLMRAEEVLLWGSRWFASIMKTVERKGTQFVDVRCVVAIFFVLEGLD
jgi:hypothetical protein